MVKRKKSVKKSRKENFFKENYSLSWDYIGETKNYIYSLIGIFVLFILIGAFLPTPEHIEKLIFEFIQELLLKSEGMTRGELVNFILFNNLKSSFFGSLYGVFLGIFPILSSMTNGYLLGFVSMKSVESAGAVSLWKLFPHGIFELPALFISLGMGLRLGTFIFQKEKIDSLKYYLVNSFRVFVLIVVPLLIVAAIIEGSLIFLGS